AAQQSPPAPHRSRRTTTHNPRHQPVWTRHLAHTLPTADGAATDAGAPVRVLQKIAGHGSLSTTQRYLHPDRRSSEAAGQALSAHLTAGRSPGGPRLRAV